MAKKKTEIDPNLILYAASGVVGLIFVNKIMVKFGLIGGRGTTRVMQQTQLPDSPWKPNYYQRVGGRVLPAGYAQQLAKSIYDALNWYSDDEAAVFGVFGNLVAKSQVSYLSDVFYQKYQTDLLNFLKEGSGVFPWNGLGDDDLLRLTNLVDRLPAK